MLLHDILWIEDDEKFVRGILKNFKEDSQELGYNISPFHYTSLEDFETNSKMELGAIAMKLVCVDYNLPNGVNGDEIIKLIRSNKANHNIPIIFYSYAKNETELKDLLSAELKDLSNIYFSHKGDLEDNILNHLNG